MNIRSIIKTELSPKGHKAKKDTSGFVIRNYANQ